MGETYRVRFRLIVTADTTVGADDAGVDMDLELPEEGRGPKLRLIQGGPASCCKEE